MAKFRKVGFGKVNIPKLNPHDFDIQGYKCMFIKPQPDNRIVGLYVTDTPEDYHWLVIVGDRQVRCPTLARAKEYCKKMHYDIGVGS